MSGTGSGGSQKDVNDDLQPAVDRNLEIQDSEPMKTTVEIEDELYRDAEAYASLTGRRMKDLVTEGLRLVLQSPPRPATRAEASKKLAACFAEADKAMASAPRGPTAREHLGKGRGRLEMP